MNYNCSVCGEPMFTGEDVTSVEIVYNLCWRCARTVNK